MNKIVYEANLLRIDGTVYGMQILICASEVEALARASHCATRWAASVRLYQVPYIKEGNEPWRKDEIRFVADVAWGPNQFAVANRIDKKLPAPQGTRNLAVPTFCGFLLCPARG